MNPYLSALPPAAILPNVGSAYMDAFGSVAAYNSAGALCGYNGVQDCFGTMKVVANAVDNTVGSALHVHETQQRDQLGLDSCCRFQKTQTQCSYYTDIRPKDCSIPQHRRKGGGEEDSDSNVDGNQSPTKAPVSIPIPRPWVDLGGYGTYSFGFSFFGDGIFGGGSGSGGGGGGGVVRIGGYYWDGESFALVGIEGYSGHGDNGKVYSESQYPYADVTQVESKSGLAVSTGDVQLVLFDGPAVTFNGFGEYVYLLSPSVVVQGRQRPPFSEGANCSSIPSGVYPTLLYAVAVSVTTVDGVRAVISIFSGEKRPSVRYDIAGETVFLAARQKVSIAPDLRVEAGDIVIVRLGTVFKLKVQQFSLGNLKMNVLLSRKEFFNATTGLFGTFTDSAADDFRLPNGSYYALPRSVEMPSKLLYEHWATHWQVPHAYPSLFPYDAARNEGWTNHTCPLFLPAFESDDLRGFVSESFFATAAEFCSTAVDSALYFQCLLEQVLMHRFVRDTQQLRESIVDLNDIFQQQKRLHNEVPAFAAGSRLYQVYQWCHLNLSLRATDPEGSPIQYAVHAVPADSLFNSSTGGFSWYAGAASQGLHVVNISASDGVHTISRVFGINVTVLRTPGPSPAPTADPSAEPSPLATSRPTSAAPTVEPTYGWSMSY